MISVTKPPERMLFGQFLLEQKIITGNELALALYQQSKERVYNHTPRRLGEILLDSYGGFQSRKELDKALLDFKAFKEELAGIYNDAREIVRTEKMVSGCVDPQTISDAEQIGINLAGIEVEELQGYVSVIETFLEAADDVSKAIRLQQCAKDEMIEVMRRMADIRQSLLSIASPEASS